MEFVRVYITDNKNVIVTCPKCNSIRKLDFSNRDIPYSVKAKCSCGHQFAIQFDKRIYYRKQVASTGLCFSSAGSEDDNMIRLHDISRSGLAFTKEKGTNFHVGDDVDLQFTLGENKVRCAVTVVSVQGARIGAKFTKLDEHTQKIIGFFLMP